MSRMHTAAVPCSALALALLSAALPGLPAPPMAASRETSMVEAHARGVQSPGASRAEALRHPESLANGGRAPDHFRVRLDTTKGPIVIEVHRAWAPHGADWFFTLVADGYYDDSRFFRVVKGKWAQFGINGDPAISNAWRTATIPDDPRVESNTHGSVAFAFAVPNGRTTQVFINLQDNSATHDREPFVPFGRIVEGLAVADALNAEYGETSGSGIRAGRQGPLFEGGNVYLAEHFPRLDVIKTATIER